MKNFTLTLFLSVPWWLLAQSPAPGGVKGTQLWFRTTPENINLQGFYKWQDFSGDSLKANLYDSRGAAFGEEFRADRSRVRTFNFNPSLNISENNRTKEALVKYSNLSQATIIGIFAPANNFSSDALLYGLNGRPGQGVLLSKDKVVHASGSGKTPLDYGEADGDDLRYSQGDPETTENRFRESALRIASYYRANQPNHSLWGEKQQAVITLGKTYNSANVNFTSQFDQALFGNNEMQGYCPELIIYNRMLDPIERRKAETYLAVKYGVTLKMSYIGSNDQLLWDLDANPLFNNRVTGILRDDTDGLNQRLSTTSYQETPYFSDAYDTYDTYNNADTRTIRPSRYRLLTIGRQQANRLGNGQYFIWGDNNASLITKPSQTFPGLQVMQRAWKAVTNLDSLNILNGQPLWHADNLTVTDKKFTLVLQKAANVTQGSVITSVPLLGDNGYLAFTKQNDGAMITAKFGANNAASASGSNDYGFYVTSQGALYSIVKGVTSANTLGMISNGSRLEVFKEKTIVYLCVNGLRYTEYQIAIDPVHQSQSYYGALRIASTGSGQIPAIALENIRYGGFTDTGNRVELAYSANLAADFEMFPNNALLLIDGTGAGNFEQKNIRMTRVSEVDTQRKKLIFNNVFWDADKNGVESFTFAYITDLYGEITPVDATCNGNTPNADGKIEVKIIVGNPCYTYRLTDSLVSGQPPRVVKSGSSCDNNFSLTGLLPGDYTLTISQQSGFNLKNDPQASFAQMGTLTATTNGSMQWTVRDLTSKYDAGFTLPVNFITLSTSVLHGVHVNGDKLYPIVNGYISPTSIATVKKEDVIRVERNGTRVVTYLNNQQIQTQTISFFHYLVGYSAFARFYAGTQSALYGIVYSAAGSGDWAGTGVTSETFRQTGIVHKVTIQSPCSQSIIPQAVEPPQPEMSDKPEFTLRGVKTGEGTEYDASLKLVNPGQTMLAVFSIEGKMIGKYPMTGGDLLKTVKFHIRGNGVYIVKVFSPDGEFTKKVLVQ